MRAGDSPIRSRILAERGAMIDLHFHSTFSDGSVPPEGLVRMGKEIGLTAMALTDHDSTGGVDRFLASCRKAGLTGISGVEISAEISRGTLHMLAYFIDPRNAKLESVLERIRGGRSARNEEILAKLNGMGFELTWEEVLAFAGEDVVGRPHLARALVQRGYVDSTKQAFNLYLAKGRKAYAERFRLPPAECIAVIRGAGGVAVLAHPFTLELNRGALREYVSGLAGRGLGGIEVRYSEHSSSQVAQYTALADEFDLAPTGGSDFHGQVNPEIKIGTGFGSLNVPDACVEALRRKAEAKATGVGNRAHSGEKT